MHKLMQYLCDELEELERKAEKDGKLSMAEVQYMDTLAHTKKNLLKADELWEESEYSMEDPYARRGSYSYARGGRGGSRRGGNRGGNRGANQYGSYDMGGYSRANDMADQLRDMMQDAPDEKTRQEIQRLVNKLDQM